MTLTFTDVVVLYLLVVLPSVSLLCGVIIYVAAAPRRSLAQQSTQKRSAQQRAEQLLMEVLTTKEFRQFKTHGYLDVPSPSCPDRVYRVRGGGGPVQVREAGRASVLLCVQPQNWLPAADVVLMHKLLIEGDEYRYRRTANVVD